MFFVCYESIKREPKIRGIKILLDSCCFSFFLPFFLLRKTRAWRKEDFEMSFKHAQSFKRGQVWEAGFDGPHNTDYAVDPVTGKVGEQHERVIESKVLQIHREREQEAFERTVAARAEQLKNAFSKLDLDRDGKLSFEEFSHGLWSLGVVLPKKEIEAIWSQVLPILLT
jgi:hypothetical protein